MFIALNLVLLKDCPVWSAWGVWGKCSATCGAGIRTHMRTCINGALGDLGCNGPEEEEGPCEEFVSLNSKSQEQSVLSVHAITN